MRLPKMSLCTIALATGILVFTVSENFVSAVRADTTVVTPNFANTEADSMYTFNEDFSAQQLISSSVLNTVTVGSSITGVQFRLNDTQAAVNTPINFDNFDIYLGGSTVNALTAGQSYTANMAADTVLVRSGPLNFAANVFASGGSPNAFGPVIVFSTPYIYTGNDLLFTFTFTSPGLIFRVDASVGSAIGVDYMQGAGYNDPTSDLDFDNTSVVAQFQFSPAVATVPEANTFALALPALGMIGAVILRRRKK